MPFTWTKPRREPDFSRIERLLRRQNQNEPVAFTELHIQARPDLVEAIREPGETPLPRASSEDNGTNRKIWMMHRLGYDYVMIQPNNFNFPKPARPQGESEEFGTVHAYVQAGAKMIADRADFESFPWPRMQDVDYGVIEQAANELPEGMKMIGLSPGGILENVMWILGFEGLSYLIFDDEQLVADMFEAVSTRIIETFDTMAAMDSVGAMCLSDDIGFKTQPMISPAMLRKFVFPWHKKVVDTVHKHGKPICLHACGNRSAIMEDMIACGWDGIHSHQDVIYPIWEEKEKYGNRMSFLGGFDIDKICRFDEEQVRAHTRVLMEKCMPGGGWGLGTGNSVASYVPGWHFLAMLDQAKKTW